MPEPSSISPLQERVYAAVTAAMAAQERAPYAQEVAREAGLDEGQVREALSALTDAGLVAEMEGVEDSGEDLGPRYTAKQRP